MKPNIIQFPSTIIEDSAIADIMRNGTIQHLGLYVYLLHLQRTQQPRNVDTLSETLGCSVDHTYNLLWRLMDIGVVEAVYADGLTHKQKWEQKQNE